MNKRNMEFTLRHARGGCCPCRCDVAVVAATALALCVAALGCGPKRPDTVAVRGTVTFQGGAPPAEGAIYFAPIDVAEGVPRRPGVALFDTSGRYEATSFEGGDGLVPATYKVRVDCWKSAPTMDNPTGESHVPADFSAPDLVVGTDAWSVTHDVDIPAPVK